MLVRAPYSSCDRVLSVTWFIHSQIQWPSWKDMDWATVREAAISLTFVLAMMRWTLDTCSPRDQLQAMRGHCQECPQVVQRGILMVAFGEEGSTGCYRLATLRWLLLQGCPPPLLQAVTQGAQSHWSSRLKDESLPVILQLVRGSPQPPKGR